jgi:hypothetical protein
LLSDHTLDFLYTGIVAADPLALEGIILLHAPSQIPGLFPENAIISLPDSYKFAAYAVLMARLFGQQAIGPQVSELLERVMANFSPQQTSQLMSFVDREEKRWRAQSLKFRTRELPERMERAASLCDDSAGQ